MAKGLLFAAFDYAPAKEDEFHDWYDLEHIPERLRVPVENETDLVVHMDV